MTKLVGQSEGEWVKRWIRDSQLEEYIALGDITDEILYDCINNAEEEDNHKEGFIMKPGSIAGDEYEEEDKDRKLGWGLL